MKKLVVTVEPGAPTRMTLAGRIDDGAGLSLVATRVPAGDVVVDASGVTFVNSVGMRDWIRLVRVLTARGRVVLERVADVLMTQMNLIPELKTSVRVASFHAQYACDACGSESAPAVDAVAHATSLAAMTAPRLPCPECGAAMQLADFPERYLMMFQP